MYVHARLIPLDYYELTFVTPVTSVVMCAVCGFLLGIFFARALLRGNKGVRRGIYITVACVVVSFLYSTGFVANAIFALAADLVMNFGAAVDSAALSDVVRQRSVEMALGMGDVEVQVLADAALMSLACIAGNVGVVGSNPIISTTAHQYEPVYVGFIGNRFVLRRKF